VRVCCARDRSKHTHTLRHTLTHTHSNTLHIIIICLIRTTAKQCTLAQTSFNTPCRLYCGMFMCVPFRTQSHRSLTNTSIPSHHSLTHTYTHSDSESLTLHTLLSTRVHNTQTNHGHPHAHTHTHTVTRTANHKHNKPSNKPYS